MKVPHLHEWLCSVGWVVVLVWFFFFLFKNALKKGKGQNLILFITNLVESPIASLKLCVQGEAEEFRKVPSNRISWLPGS